MVQHVLAILFILKLVKRSKFYTTKFISCIFNVVFESFVLSICKVS